MTQHIDMHQRLVDGSATPILPLPAAGLTVGTMIMTPEGQRAVEAITAGDRVLTKDYGYQIVKSVTFQDVGLDDAGQLAPIRVSPCALGAERPICDTFLAPYQRIAVQHPLFDMLFKTREVVIAARDLLGLEGVTSVKGLRGITYVALHFAKPQLLFSGTLVLDVSRPDQTPPRALLSSDEAEFAATMLCPPKRVEPEMRGRLH